MYFDTTSANVRSLQFTRKYVLALVVAEGPGVGSRGWGQRGVRYCFGMSVVCCIGSPSIVLSSFPDRVFPGLAGLASRKQAAFFRALSEFGCAGMGRLGLLLDAFDQHEVS